MKTTSKFLFVLALGIITAMDGNAQGTWKQLSPNPGPDIYSYFHMANDQTGRAYGWTNDAITSNGGASWNIGPGDKSNIHFRTRTLGVGFDPNNRLIKSTDGGQNWNVLQNPFDWPSVSFLNENIGYVFNRQSSLFKFTCKTTDGGLTWDTTTAPGADTVAISKIYCTSANVLLGTPTSQLLYRSTNSGASWRRYTIPGLKKVTDFLFLGPDTGWVAGDSGKVARTYNNGISWYMTNAPTTSSMLHLQFISKSKGWAVAGGKLFTTSNGGDTWTLIPTSGGQTVRCFDFINDQVGWVAGYRLNATDWISKTTDGGITWQRQTTGFIDNIAASCYQGSSRVWITGSNGLLAYTANYGTTWTQKSVDSTVNFTSVQFINRSLGYLAGKGKIYKSLDSGKTWIGKVVFPGATSSSTDFMQFINSDTGWAIGQAGFSKTTDGGQTWSNQPSQTKHSGKVLQFLSPQLGFKAESVRDGNLNNYIKISKTVDGGNTWTAISDSTMWALLFTPVLNDLRV